VGGFLNLGGGGRRDRGGGRGKMMWGGRKVKVYRSPKKKKGCERSSKVGGENREGGTVTQLNEKSTLGV